MQENKQKTVEIVVQAEGSGGLLWSPNGTVHIAMDAAALGRFAVSVATDDATPAVSFEAPQSVWESAARRVLTELGGSARVADPDACAVHLVLRVDESESEGVAAAVYPPKGRPRLAQGVESIGALLVELASDDAQPKVRPGAPPDTASELMQGAAEIAVRYLQGEGR